MRIHMWPWGRGAGHRVHDHGTHTHTIRSTCTADSSMAHAARPAASRRLDERRRRLESPRVGPCRVSMAWSSRRLSTSHVRFIIDIHLTICNWINLLRLRYVAPRAHM